MGRRPSLRTWLVAGAMAVAVAGCGDEGSSTTTNTASSAPDAAQPVTELVSAIEQLSPEGDCEQTVKVLNPVDLPDPEGGPSASNCQRIQALVDLLHGFEPSDSAEFGTGALIDGTAGGKEIALTAALDQAEHFKLTATSERKSQIDTKGAPDVDFEAPAAAFVKALRDDDCTSAHAAIAPISRLAYGNLKQFCSVFEDNFMADASSLGARLQADPTADLIDFGGTRNAHFFGLPTNPAGYRTIFVGTVAGGQPLVLDVLPVER